MSISLENLIATAKLPIGTKLYHKGRQRPPQECQIVAGGIKFGSKVYKTPSAAAKSVTGRPVDGWLFWRLPNKAYLASLRSAET